MTQEADRLKPKLLVVELWGLGDLVIATPFLQAASERYSVTLLAKPYAADLQGRFWPGVKVVPFIAPWTAFRRKYRLPEWPWREMFHLRKLAAERFAVGLSARWDPRDHFLLRLSRAKVRLGFPRLQSQMFLTQPLARPAPEAHRYENWRVLARALDLALPAREDIRIPEAHHGRQVLVHSGAGQPVRVWPLERFAKLVGRLRKGNYRVQVACDPDQREWWLAAGETTLITPRNVTELFALVDGAGVFVGNDSGPAHLAALSGVPTFTLFGPQLPEWFAPLHPAGEWLEGKACPYKPCSDYCRFPVSYCMVNSSEEEVWGRVAPFVARRLEDRISGPMAPRHSCVWPK
jgi:ADP-heptose:LPS heptosyltransferase